jgi:hypothetical protein
MMTWSVQHISQTIDAPVEAVVTVAGDPKQLPRWAAGLSAGIRLESGRWLTDSPLGTIEVKYVGPTEWGILDHDVTLPDQTVVHNPLRVLRNDRGSEVVFSLFKRPGITDSEFDADAMIVREDLARLKNLVDCERLSVE